MVHTNRYVTQNIGHGRLDQLEDVAEREVYDYNRQHRPVHPAPPAHVQELLSQLAGLGA